MTNTNTNTTYAVRYYSHTFAVERFASLDEAVAAVRAVHADAVIDTDALPEARALCWSDEASVENDDNSRAVASISAVTHCAP